jgi:uncharacterized membrane protein
MKKSMEIVVLGLVLGLGFIGCSQTIKADTALVQLNVRVQDINGVIVNNARVSVTYRFPQDEDPDIPDAFTKNGIASFQLESEREYSITVTKAGFLSHTEQVELDDTTTITVTLEYAQSTPILHMKRYHVTPTEVNPGVSFQVNITMENEGTGDALNVTVTFEPTSDITAVQPTSSHYFERVDAGCITSLTQTFAVSGEAESGVYDLSLDIQYQDAEGTSYTVQETIGISILRQPKIKLLNIDYPEELVEGESFVFSVEIANTGRFPVHGLYIQVDSDMDWEYSSYYVGTLEAGDFDTFQSEVVPQPGEHTIVITVGYVDDFNREHTQKESISVSVQSKVQETKPPDDEQGIWQRIIAFLKSFLGLD